MRVHPLVRFGTATAQAVEAAGVCVASVLSAMDTASGKSYQLGSGIALTVIGFGTAAALAFVATGLARARSWSWTPAMLIQLFTLITGIYLLQGHRYDWGAPAVALPVAVAAVLLLPASLAGYGRKPAAPPQAGRDKPGPARSGPTRPRSGRP